MSTADLDHPAPAYPASPGSPPPPPGPGVQPPFVAPPTDGARQRRWLAVGLAGAAALVCCVGSLFGLGGVVVLGGRMVIDQARGAVTDYLGAIRDERYAEAYGLLCESEQASVDEAEFVDSFETGPALRTFSVGEAILTEEMVVPATFTFDNGSSEAVRYLLIQDTETAEFEVCGETG